MELVWCNVSSLKHTLVQAARSKGRSTPLVVLMVNGGALAANQVIGPYAQGGAPAVVEIFYPNSAGARAIG
jgi:hypothetical protein